MPRAGERQPGRECARLGQGERPPLVSHRCCDPVTGGYLGIRPGLKEVQGTNRHRGSAFQAFSNIHPFEKTLETCFVFIECGMCTSSRCKTAKPLLIAEVVIQKPEVCKKTASLECYLAQNNMLRTQRPSTYYKPISSRWPQFVQYCDCMPERMNRSFNRKASCAAVSSCVFRMDTHYIMAVHFQRALPARVPLKLALLLLIFGDIDGAHPKHATKLGVETPILPRPDSFDRKLTQSHILV